MSKKKKKNQTVIRSLIYNLCGVLRLTSAGQTRQISQGPFYNWVFSSQCILVYTKISTIHPNVLYVFVFQIFPATFPSIPWTSVPGRSTKMRQREFTRTRLLLSRHTWQRKWWYEGGREGGRKSGSSLHPQSSLRTAVTSSNLLCFLSHSLSWRLQTVPLSLTTAVNLLFTSDQTDQSEDRIPAPPAPVHSLISKHIHRVCWDRTFIVVIIIII